MELKERIKNFFSDVFSISENKASNGDIKASIVSGAKLKGTNMCILICAIIIASIGLNMNSVAVIIGAMLISPMMGAIIGIGYAIATNDFKFAKRALVALIIQIAISVITSSIYFIVSPISDTSSELLSRTMPTIWDVLIAIVGGLAGAIGMTRKEKSNVIPGVAIATGLMPPLCTVGYGISMKNLSYVGGAFYLFFINAFFICLSSIIVFKVMKMPKRKGADAKEERKIRRNLAIIAIITIIPSVFLARQIVKESIINSNVQKYLNTEFRYEGTQIVKSSVDVKNKKINLALIGKVLEDKEIINLSNGLKKYNLQDMTLKITQTEVKEGITKEEVEKLIQSQVGKIDTSMYANDKKDSSDGVTNITDKISEIKDKSIANTEDAKNKVKEQFDVVKECTITNNTTTTSVDKNITSLVNLVLNRDITNTESDEIDNFLKEILGDNIVISKQIERE